MPRNKMKTSLWNMYNRSRYSSCRDTPKSERRLPSTKTVVGEEILEVTEVKGFFARVKDWWGAR